VLPSVRSIGGPKVTGELWRSLEKTSRGLREWRFCFAVLSVGRSLVKISTVTKSLELTDGGLGNFLLQFSVGCSETHRFRGLATGGVRAAGSPAERVGEGVSRYPDSLAAVVGNRVPVPDAARHTTSSRAQERSQLPVVLRVVEMCLGSCLHYANSGEVSIATKHSMETVQVAYPLSFSLPPSEVIIKSADAPPSRLSSLAMPKSAADLSMQTPCHACVYAPRAPLAAV
jgi:hypothetical protein